MASSLTNQLSKAFDNLTSKAFEKKARQVYKDFNTLNGVYLSESDFKLRETVAGALIVKELQEFLKMGHRQKMPQLRTGNMFQKIFRSSATKLVVKDSLSKVTAQWKLKIHVADTGTILDRKTGFDYGDHLNRATTLGKGVKANRFQGYADRLKNKWISLATERFKGI